MFFFLNDAIIHENDAIIHENDAIIHENDAIIHENDAIIDENFVCSHKLPWFTKTISKSDYFKILADQHSAEETPVVHQMQIVAE